MRLVKIMVCWCVLIVSCFWLSGCNTMHGAGRDLEEGGKAIQDAAK